MTLAGPGNGPGSKNVADCIHNQPLGPKLRVVWPSGGPRGPNVTLLALGERPRLEKCCRLYPQSAPVSQANGRLALRGPPECQTRPWLALEPRKRLQMNWSYHFTYFSNK